MLEVKNINVFREKLQILWDVSIKVEKGEVVAILGANGAGKSTLLSTIAGLFQPSSGTILYNGREINSLPPYHIVNLGVSFVPEDRKLFPHMTVRENLILGSYSSRARSKWEETLKLVYQLFPVLEKRRNQLARSLSGGEQRMLAIARALMSNPKLLILDEPSQGLAPKLITEIFKSVAEFRAYGVSVLLAEQNVHQVLKIADRAYIMENGKVTLKGLCSDLSKNDYIKKAFLGI